MSDAIHFSSGAEFRDLKNYPYGIARSGDFTRAQAQLLVNHGSVYKGLFDGERQPCNDLEQHFVEFCRSGCGVPENEHEKAWGLYLKKLESKQAVVDCSGADSGDDSLVIPDDDMDLED